MITGWQIRAARAALDWSAQTLAERSGVGRRTIMRLEASDDLPSSRTTTPRDIQSAFEAVGVEFIGSPTDRPGIRLCLRSSSAGQSS
jgi:transcriptional regulator with XRE-family HTH domain